MFLSIALFVFIYPQHACANVRFVKIHRHPTCPPLWKKTGRASSPFSGGKNRGAGFRSQKAGAGSDGKEEDRGSPVLIPSILRVSGAGAARTLMKTPSSKRVPPPPGSEAYAVEATHNAVSRPPREPTLHASLPVRSSHKLCVSR